ncbi:hypothetical protein BCR34DRAFT_355290 [Clohesyomyces aquaticus]|uniref:Uncharacterized protein n=1 Tax=Clohesyomyces aquaticus TaxID=1231657 RepID=A0A1Y1ZIW5_9PLEO|nr:hypothetical protein BCR34DRAFT_355290 [Clohesyomyces aquaticus]
MSYSPPPNFNSSSSPVRPSGAAAALRSEALRANPNQRAFLITDGGLNQLVTHVEACNFFQMGYTPRDPVTRQPVDVGGTEMPSYAGGEGAFDPEEEEIGEERRKERERKRREYAEKGPNGFYGNEHQNGRKDNGNSHNGGPNGGVAAWSLANMPP